MNKRRRVSRSGAGVLFLRLCLSLSLAVAIQGCSKKSVHLGNFPSALSQALGSAAAVPGAKMPDASSFKAGARILSMGSLEAQSAGCSLTVLDATTGRAGVSDGRYVTYYVGQSTLWTLVGPRQKFIIVWKVAVTLA
jgi:hypothetical protein